MVILHYRISTTEILVQRMEEKLQGMCLSDTGTLFMREDEWYFSTHIILALPTTLNCILLLQSPVSKKCLFELDFELEKISEILKKVSQVSLDIFYAISL